MGPLEIGNLFSVIAIAYPNAADNSNNNDNDNTTY